MTSITVYQTRLQAPPGTPKEEALFTIKTEGKTLDFVLGESLEIPALPAPGAPIRIQVSSD